MFSRRKERSSDDSYSDSSSDESDSSMNSSSEDVSDEENGSRGNGSFRQLTPRHFPFLRHRNHSMKSKEHSNRHRSFSLDTRHERHKARRKRPFPRRDCLSSTAHPARNLIFCWSARAANALLLASFVFWVYVRAKSAHTKARQPVLTVRERIQLRRDDTSTIWERWSNLLGTSKSVPRTMERKTNKKKNTSNMETLPPDCIRADWHAYHFPNCNDVHDIDLGNIIHDNSHSKLGYLSSGMWRSVWAVEPRFINEPAVLKVMKAEHEFDLRNLDRHRRDAIAMERLTHSPHVVDIYGHCGSTVLSEYVPTSLADVLYDGVTTSHATTTTRMSPHGRWQLALQAARGVAAIHNVAGGPIVHADLQAKQFLVRSNGAVVLNDLNRCRFMAHRRNATTTTATATSCPFYIPQAPGKARAPEEYNALALDEKLDIYSLGHVLYGILTGRNAWSAWSLAETKQHVLQGDTPALNDGDVATASDQALAALMERAYRVDPRERPSAAQIVQEMEGFGGAT